MANHYCGPCPANLNLTFTEKVFVSGMGKESYCKGYQGKHWESIQPDYCFECKKWAGQFNRSNVDYGIIKKL